MATEVFTRKKRRHDPVLQERDHALSQLTALEENILRRRQEWDKSIAGTGTIVHAMFNTSPLIVNFVHDHRLFHEQLKRVEETVILPDEALEQLRRRDIIGIPLNGVSIADIATLPLDPKTHKLAPSDFDKIQDFHTFTEPIKKLLHPRKAALTDEETRILNTAAFYAIQPWAQRKKFRGDPTNEHLQQVLTAYFDEFVEHFTPDKISRQRANALFENLHFGQLWLPTAVAAFVVARLGITPSSAIKLFNQRAEQAPTHWQRYVWKYLNKKMGANAAVAYREGNLPNDIAPYQGYNPSSENAANKLLTRAYQKEKNATLPNASLDERETLIIKPNFDALLTQIATHPDEYLSFPFSQEQQGLHKVQVASQNRDVIIFVLHLNNGSHLTLELTRSGHIFGISNELKQAIPHIDSLLFRDVIQPIVQRTTEAKKVDLPPPPPVQSNRLSTFFNIFRNKNQEPETSDHTEHQPKRKHQSTPLPPNGTIFSSAHANHTNGQHTEQTSPFNQKHLRYKMQQIREDLKHDIPNLTPHEERDISSFLKSCERGEVPFHPCRPPLQGCFKAKYTFRDGDINLRFIFKSTGSSFYRLIFTFPRDEDSYSPHQIKQMKRLMKEI